MLKVLWNRLIGFFSMQKRHRISSKEHVKELWEKAKALPDEKCPIIGYDPDTGKEIRLNRDIEKLLLPPEDYFEPDFSSMTPYFRVYDQFVYVPEKDTVDYNADAEYVSVAKIERKAFRPEFRWFNENHYENEQTHPIFAKTYHALLAYENYLHSVYPKPPNEKGAAALKSQYKKLDTLNS